MYSRILTKRTLFWTKSDEKSAFKRLDFFVTIRKGIILFDLEILLINFVDLTG